MSKIIRNVVEAPAVFIGERHHDAMAEAKAEQTMQRLFPVVSLVTSPDGAKQIPIAEVYKMEKYMRDERDQAREQALKEGHQAGLNEGLNQARKVLSNFEKAIEDAVGQRIGLLEEAKENILELVLKISRKVTFEAVRIDPETTSAMIAGVIDQLVDRSRLTIKVHPDHLAIAEQNMDRFLAQSTSIKELKFEADPRVRFGGCFIETPTGDIDARLESQFEVIADSLQSGQDE